MSVEDRSWMYQGWNDNGCHSEEWVRNTNAFIDRAFSAVPNSEKFGVLCPCSDCGNRVRRRRPVMTMHLCKRGFTAGYTIWTKHGEQPYREPTLEHANDTLDGLDEMLADLGDAMHTDDIEDEPIADAKAFYAMLEASQEPLHGLTSVARLTAVTHLMAVKSQHNLSAECINKLLSLFDDVLPENHKMPKTLYECMSLLKGLKMPYVKIDACVNNCMIYYGTEDEKKEKCDFCGESRYVVVEPSQGRKRKPIPRKVLRYLPIIPRLQRLYMQPETAKHMRWHKEGRRANPNVMVHPSDAEAWTHFNTVCPDFSMDARNVRVAMATDGFNPFGFGKAKYSCWPVFVIPLNLPPALCMKEENIFLSLVIPGPEHPGKNMNVFMRPLIDEMKKGWTGVATYDSFSKRNFTMRVSYHNSIHDYPGLGMFSGWSTHGGLACIDCMADVDSTWLPNGRKFSWFDCHRRFLPPDHAFRNQKSAFKKGVAVHDPPPRRLTGQEVQAYMNEVKDASFDGYGKTHNWTHIPFLWDLPYFPQLLRPHNIDVMHTEKNVAEAIFNTCLNIADKTKDNPKARLDQALMCNRRHLNLVEKPNDRWDRPRAPFSLTRDRKKVVMQWFMDIKFPDGYAANLRKGVNMDTLKINGMKSHDFHIFIERLLPSMMRGFVKNDIWEALAELSYFFRVLCAKEVDHAQICQLEANIPIILCKLEKIFPPGFFNSMEHLLVHLPYQVRITGPVKYTWMYGVERLLKKVRAKVRNKAHVEASIVEGCLVEEISHFTSLYLPQLISSSRNCPQRYAPNGPPPDSTLSLFQVRGWKSGRGVSRFLTVEEYKTAMIFIFTNMAEMDEFVQKFEQEQWRRPRPPTSKQLDNLRMNGAGNGKPNLLDWFSKLCDIDASIPSDLRRLSRGCGLKVKSYDIYEVNGYRFRSERYEKSRGNLTTTNTGVLAIGVDDSGNNELEYYGIIKDIFELKFDGGSEFSLVLFDCHWFHPTNGVRHLERFGLVEVAHASCNPANEPFVLASQVKQVYYLPYACKSNPSLNDWWVAHKVSPLANLSIPSMDEYDNEESPCMDTFQEHGLDGEFIIDIGDGLDDMTIIDGFDEGRTPSSVLTVLLKRNHPGLVEYKGKTLVASTWKHYQAAKDSSGKSKADVVAEKFWLRFRFNPSKEDVSREHVGVCCSQLLGSIMYYLRITATIDHFRKVEKRKICDKMAGQFYLTRDDYIAQQPPWFPRDAWEVLATDWSSPKFKEKSEKNRANRCSDKFKPHKGGSNSIVTIRQKLSKKLGREVTDIEAWVHTHRGSNPEDITSLNTEEATICLEKYKGKAIELNGPDFDWLHSPIDTRALYQCSCGRPHGKWALFNGAINDNEALADLKRSHASAMASTRQRQEEEDRMRQEAGDSRLAKEYAQKMMEWGRVLHARIQSIERFMENVAFHTGMPATAFSAPMSPPPDPPTYAVLPTPNPSHDNDNAGTFGSSVRAETPDETISRIASGVFRGHPSGTNAGVNGVNETTSGVNGTASGGGTYSPPVEEEQFPFF